MLGEPAKVYLPVCVCVCEGVGQDDLLGLSTTFACVH